MDFLLKPMFVREFRFNTSFIFVSDRNHSFIVLIISVELLLTESDVYLLDLHIVNLMVSLAFLCQRNLLTRNKYVLVGVKAHKNRASVTWDHNFISVLFVYAD